MALKGDNGKYLSRFGDTKTRLVKSELDPYTRFVASEIDGKLVLQADTGKYLSRMTRHGTDYIEAVKDSPDWYSKFTVHNQPDGTVVLQADSGKYMSRFGKDSYYEAAKDTIDVYCKLYLEFQL